MMIDVFIISLCFGYDKGLEVVIIIYLQQQKIETNVCAQAVPQLFIALHWRYDFWFWRGLFCEINAPTMPPVCVFGNCNPACAVKLSR